MNTQSKTLTAPYAHSERADESFIDVLKRARATVALWHSRARQRRALAELSAELLDDIGVSPHQAAMEARKPFWRG